MSNKNDKYIRVEKEKPKNEQAPENEIRVTVVKGMRNYITYAISLFNNKEKVFDQIHLKAMGRAINKTGINLKKKNITFNFFYLF